MGKDGKWDVVDLKAKITKAKAEKGSYNSKKDSEKVGTLTKKKSKESGIYELLDTKEKKE
jgi:hypothetical protein